MVFWLAVLVAAFFAWVAVQVGFYAAWTMLFTLLLAAYLAIFLSPVVIENVPAATDTPYGFTLVFLCIAVATLILSYGICYAILSGRLRYEFPKILDTIGAGIVGFLAGFLASSTLTFSLALLPLQDLDWLRSLGLEASAQKTNMAYMCWWCDVLHTLASSSETEVTSAEAVDMLLTRAAASAEGATASSGTETSGTSATEASKRAPSTAPNAGTYSQPTPNTYNPSGTSNRAGGYENKAQSMQPSQRAGNMMPPATNTTPPADGALPPATNAAPPADSGGGRIGNPSDGNTTTPAPSGTR